MTGAPRTAVAMRLHPSLLIALLAGCSSAPSAPPVVFTPGVEGRSASEVCQTTSQECQTWTELAKKCEESLRQQEAGYMGRHEPYCTQAEEYREAVTGVLNSSSTGAYAF